MLQTQSASPGASTAALHRLQPPPVPGWPQWAPHCVINQTLTRPLNAPHAQTAHAAARGGPSPQGCASSRTAGAAARAPGLLMGGDGLGQPVQAVHVVVGGQVLLAGGTDGPGLEASPKHTCMGEVVARASSEPARLGPEHPRAPPGAPRTPRQRLVPAPRTWHVGGLLQAVVGAPILGALHEVRRLVHVLGREGEGRRGERREWRRSLPHQGPAEVQGRSRGAAAGSSARATHNPHAVEGHLVVEVLHHVVPPLVSLWVGEVWEDRRAWPDLREGGSNVQSPAKTHCAPQPPRATPLSTMAVPRLFPSSSRGPTRAPSHRDQGCSPHTPSQSGAALWRFG